MDIWSRRIVGWSMGPNITAELADEALKMAPARRNPPEGCVYHSDHGSQYVSLPLSKTMRDNGIRPSMGSISSPWDNAAMESLMGIVKSECVHARTYATREEAALDLFERIEIIYNRAKTHSALGYLSPGQSSKRSTGRRKKAARRRRKRCQWNRGRFIKTLADFDWGFQPSGLVEQLATLEFVDRGDNVVLVSSPGVGKTHPSIAIGHEAVMARRQVYFADCSRLVEDLKHASAKETLARRMRFYEHCSLLIIDELGYLDIGKEGADLLFQLVNRRYALKRSTIVTTNVPVGRWGDVFGSNVTASAVADGLCHHCAMIKITGRSYRLKDVSIGGEDGREEERA